MSNSLGSYGRYVPTAHYSLNFLKVFKRLFTLVVLIAGLSQSFELKAQDPNLFYYISDGNNTLYTINRNTGAITTIGATGVGVIEAIAYYPIPTNRTLYAANASTFGTLNRTTGVYTQIGEIDGGGTANGSAGAQSLNDVDGLMLDAQSLIMWAVERNSGAPDLLFQIDITTGLFVADAFGSGVDYLEITGESINVDVDDLAVDPSSGEIYGVTNSGGSGDALFRVNKATGIFEFVATLGDSDIEGLSFSNDGRLYGSKGSGDEDLIEFDITTGAVLNRFEFTSGSDVEGLAALVADANELSGTVYNDLDTDGVRDGGETGIQGVTVYLYLDANGDGQVDPEDTRIQSTVTDVNGDYAFFYATTGTLLTTTEFTSYPSGFSLTTDNVELAAFTDAVNFGESDTNNNFGLATGVDCDGDGLSDFEEGFGDSDGDGILDQCDLDSDNDGILDSVEGPSDFDDDGIPNYLDRDSDDDGIPDAIEAEGGSAPPEYVASQGNVAGVDTNSNGIVDSRESLALDGTTIAANPDSDNDGFNDVLDLDSDNDGILDIREAGASTDADNDGQIDAFVDANGNGYDDNLETSPLPIPNTDSSYETANGLTLRPNYIDQDSDADGIDDTREGYSTTGYLFPSVIEDVDQDGIIDFWDTSSGQTPITPYDNDSDGLPDYIDENSDNDTESDFIEGNDANFDGIADTANSGLDDNNNGIDDAFDTNCVGGTSSFFASGDYAEEGGSVNTGSSDLEFNDDGGTNQEVGVYFPNITLDQGADVGSAYVQFQVDESQSGAVTITIEGHLTNDAQDFDALNDVVGRSRTTVSATWNPVDWPTVGQANEDQRTVDISAIIEEIIGQAGWVNGNDLVLIFSGATGAGRRTAENNPTLVITESNGMATTVCSTNVSLPDEDSNGEYDFRETLAEDSDFDGVPDVDDIDDDNDGILDVDEGCATQSIAAGNATSAIEVVARVEDEADGIDGENGNFARFRDDGATMDVTLRGGAVVASGTEITVRAQKRNADALNRMQVLESTNGTDFTNAVTFSFTDEDTYENKVYTLSIDATHIRIIYLRDGGDLRVDNVSYAAFSGFICDDTDGDGIPDRLDLDSDNDGISDIIEAGGVDTDNNGRVDNYTEGAFNDGLAEVFETGIADQSNQPLTDSDNDGIRDNLDLDSDNDGIQDIIEAGGVDADGNGVVDDNTDTNNNGWANTFDSANGGSVLVDTDTDSDGLPNRIDIDSDGDGIVDLIESQATTGTPIIPSGTDSDNDGIDNNFDPDSGNSLTTPVDTDNDTIPDYLDTNSDNDSFSDTLEGWDTDGDFDAETVPVGTDTDGDGLDDAYDTVSGPNSTTNVYNNQDANDFPDVTTSSDTSERDWREVNATDTDGDGVPDNIDIDDDNDGILDINEGCIDEVVAGGTATAASVVVSDVANIANAIDGDDGTRADFNNNNATLEIELRSGNIVGSGTAITIRAQRREDDTQFIVTESIDGITFTNAVTYSFADRRVTENFIHLLSSNAIDIRIQAINYDGDIRLFEVSYAGFTFCPGNDTDGDGVPNHLDLDSDNDGILDIIEAGGIDTDQDGRVDDDTDGDNDGWANTFDSDNGGTALADPNSDGDSFQDRIDIDSDGDGIVDLIESQVTSGSPNRPLGNDDDGDGIDNVFDIDSGGTPTNPVNTDGTDNPDYLDTDSDNDGLLDSMEGWDNNGDYTVDVSPSGTDTDGDGLDDAYDNLSSLLPTLNVSNGQTANSFPDVSTVGNTTERDWRESNFTDCEPGDVNSNLLFWLRADDGGANWRDISNNYSSLTGTGSLFTGSSINFNPTVAFGGSNYYTTNLAVDASSNSDLAVIAVYRPSSTDAGAVWGESNGGSFSRYILDGSGGDNSSVSNGTPMSESDISGLFESGQVTLASVIFDEDQSNGSSVRINGENALTFTANQDGQAANNFQIGAIGDDTNPFTGDLAEIIVYNQLLASSNDLRQIESYLAIKYGITMAGATTGDYLFSDGSTVWDADEVAGFQNNIAGIGRDDASCLNQLQSKSINSDAIVTIGVDDNGDGLEGSNAANESSFDNDLSALIWGHDGEDLYDNSENIDYDPIQVNSRLNREWRVQRTGSGSEQVTISFDVSSLLGPTGVGTNDEQQIVLLTDADGDFTSGANLVNQSLVVNDDGTVTFILSTFPDGTYFTLGSSEPGALPIVLLSFDATPEESSVVLNWKTASETNNSFFRLEKSKNGFDFEPFAYLDGAGTTSEINSYTYTDENPFNGLNYYRLIDVATNGDENSSEVVRVFIESSLEVSSPYPNPIRKSDQLTIDIPFGASVENLHVIDMRGIRIPIKHELSSTRIFIQMPQALTGMHVVRFNIEEKVFQFKVLVRD